MNSSAAKKDRHIRNGGASVAELDAGRREVALSVTPCGPAVRLALARVFCRAMTAAWWRSIVSTHGNAPPLRAPFATCEEPPIAEPLIALANEMGLAAAALPVESAAYQIGLTYTALLPAEHRARHGIYYTPPALAARLIEQATDAGVDWTHCRVLDPACGGGAFLAPVARRIAAALPDCEPGILVRNIAARLRGYEIDPFAAWLSQVTLEAILLPAIQGSGQRLPLLVRVCDSLRDTSTREQFDLVIGNPPYGRVTLDERDRAIYKRSLYGHANLYGLFTDFALRQTRPGGHVAYVTPTSFLSGQYFRNLRALLLAEAPPAAIDFVSARKGVFTDVLQETLLATYRKGARATRVVVHSITVTSHDSAALDRVGSCALPTIASDPWLIPRDKGRHSFVERLNRMPHRLADWGYSVSTGPLVWNRHKTQFTDTPGKNKCPVIWAEAVSGDGRFLWRAQRRSHKPYFAPAPGDDWLMTTEPCILLQRTTAKEQRRRLIAAALPDEFIRTHRAVVIENHLNMIRPLSIRPHVPSDVVAAFLNSAAADRAFRCINGSVAVSAYELEALPLPSPDALGELSALVAARATPDSIDRACDRLYVR
jgi:adenine-specific DNA-methyltransferase